jgi:hypothetical protein
MEISIVKFTEYRGLKKIPLDDYRVLPEDQEERKKVVEQLKSIGAFNLQLIQAEVMPCVVNLNESVLKFPKTGRRAHITELIFEDNPNYLDIYFSRNITIKELEV